MKNQDLSLFESRSTVTVKFGETRMLGGVADGNKEDNVVLVALPVGMAACRKMEGCWTPLHCWLTVDDCIRESYPSMTLSQQAELAGHFTIMQASVTKLNATVTTLLMLAGADHAIIASAMAEANRYSVH